MTDEPIDTTAQARLYSKLIEVMGAVGYVKKTGRNTFHNYNYVTEEDLINEVRGHLASRNVMFLPSAGEITERGITTEKGKASCVTTVRVAYTFVDGDTGATHTCQWAGSGDDSADKGLYKAYTGSMKYFLMKAFMIPTGDDPERDTRPAAPPDPVIDAARASEIRALLGQALAGSLKEAQLAEVFARAGAYPDVVNGQAVTALTAGQADLLTASLREYLTEPAQLEATPA
jgi:hypothetical protein